MRALVPAPDATAADWVIEGLRGFAASVLSVVPAGFSDYVRVFHPAYRFEDGERVPVRWAEIAATHGTKVHPGMQVGLVARRDEVYAPPPPGLHWPDDGSLPQEVAPAVVAALGAHTTTPQRCWFAVWEGWAEIQADELLQASATFRVPHRRYHLLHGPLEAAVDGVLAEGYRSAQLIWPDDHVWCLATEVDLNSTYIGCSAACRSGLLAARELEALAVDPGTGIAYDSDILNGPSIG